MYPRKITRNWVPLKNFTHPQHPPPQLSWVLNIKVRSCWLWYRSSNSLPEVFPFLALLPFNSEWFNFFFFNSIVFAYFQHLPHVAWCQISSSKQTSRNVCSHHLQRWGGSLEGTIDKITLLQGNCSAEVALAGMSPCASHSKAARRLLLSPADGWRGSHHSARAFWMASLGCRWAELLLCVWEGNAKPQPKLGSPSKCVWKGHLCQSQHSFQLSQALPSSWPLCNPVREWGLQASLKFPFGICFSCTNSLFLLLLSHIKGSENSSTLSIWEMR